MISQRELERMEGEEWMRQKELDKLINDEHFYAEMANDVDYLKKIGVYNSSNPTKITEETS